jgi:hypothetical protein
VSAGERSRQDLWVVGRRPVWRGRRLGRGERGEEVGGRFSYSANLLQQITAGGEGQDGYFGSPDNRETLLDTMPTLVGWKSAVFC